MHNPTRSVPDDGAPCRQHEPPCTVHHRERAVTRMFDLYGTAGNGRAYIDANTNSNNTADTISVQLHTEAAEPPAALSIEAIAETISEFDRQLQRVNEVIDGSSAVGHHHQVVHGFQDSDVVYDGNEPPPLTTSISWHDGGPALLELSNGARFDVMRTTVSQDPGSAIRSVDVVARPQVSGVRTMLEVTMELRARSDGAPFNVLSLDDPNTHQVDRFDHATRTVTLDHGERVPWELAPELLNRRWVTPYGTRVGRVSAGRWHEINLAGGALQPGEPVVQSTGQPARGRPERRGENVIRCRKIADRTYQVLYNGRSIGVVRNDGHARPFRAVLTVNRFTTNHAARELMDEADVEHVWSAGASHPTRTDAIRSLMTLSDLDPDSYAPASRTSGNRGTRRATTTTRNRGRAFGIEMELTGPSREIILHALRAAGINVRDVRAYRASNGAQWELKHDGSVSGFGLELVSPKLYGEDGFEQIRTVCAALASVGATVNRSCGLHVHHDMRRRDVATIRRQVIAFVERQDLVDQLVAPSRRGNSYCNRWTSGQVQQLMAVRDLNDMQYVGPRGSLNLRAYGRHGSVEIRQHGGTTNARKIIAWVRFGQAIFNAADAEAELSGTDVRQLMTQLLPFGLTVEDAATLLRFANHGETRSAIEANIREAQEMLEEVDA